MTFVNVLRISFWGRGGGKKEYDKRYIYFSFAESNQNKHMTPTRYDSTHFDTFPLLSLPMTLKTKTNLKFSLPQGSIRSQCISNRFCLFVSLFVFCEFLLINLLHQRLMLLIRLWSMNNSWNFLADSFLAS